MPMPSPEDEIALIEAFADTKVIGVTINHEGMNDGEVDATIALQSKRLGLPITDALSRPVADLLSMVVLAYPNLQQEPVTAA